MVDPALFLDMIQVDKTTRVSVSVGGCQNTSPSKLQSLLGGEVVFVLSIQNTIGKSLTTAHAEKVAGQSCAVAVDVVERGALLWGDASAHGAHAEAHALVAVDEVGEDFAGGGNTDTALVTQLMQTALHAQPGQPVLAISGTTSQSTEQDLVDLNDLLDCLRSNPVAGCRSRICGRDDATLEAEGKRRRSVGDFDGAVGV